VAALQTLPGDTDPPLQQGEAVLSSLAARTAHYQGMLIPIMTSGTTRRLTLSCRRVLSPGQGLPTPRGELSTLLSSSQIPSHQHIVEWTCDWPQQRQLEGTAGAETITLSLSRNNRRSKTPTMERAISACQTLGSLQRRTGSSKASKDQGPVLGNPT